jgi:hypothetical protein
MMLERLKLGARGAVRRAYVNAAWITHPRMFAANAALLGRHAGRRGFVVLNGVSVLDVPFRLLADEITFACNHITRHEDFAALRLKYYAEIHSLKTCQTSPLPENRIERIFDAAVSRSAPDHRFTALLHWTLRDTGRRLLGERAAESFFFIPQDASGPSRAPSLDPRRPMPLMQGTVYFLVALGLMMGLREIYLLGAGYTYRPYQWGHFYEPIAAAQLTDQNRAQVIEPMHQEMRRLAEARGARIINVVPEGHESPVYEAMPMREFLGMLGAGREPSRR